MNILNHTAHAKINTMKSRRTGFTIVELLVVIVVIAILATIVVVAYNGIQTRAENTKTATAISAYSRALLSYAQLNSIYPTATSDCMADSNTTCSMVSGSPACFGLGATSIDTTFDDEVKTIITTLPKLSDQTMRCGTATYQGGFLNTPNSKNMNMYVFFKGDITCPLVSGVSTPIKTQQDEVTYCRYAFPAL
jgi:prepilin-type N-terminal cleavage/methylation domain-containing protein